MNYNESLPLPNSTWNHENEDKHEGEEEEIIPPGFSPDVDTFPVILAILIVIANIAVMYLVARNRRLRNITNSFLVSFAVSDFMTGAVMIPCTLYCSTTYSSLLCAITPITWRFTSISSVLHLLLISMDRYAAIVYAIRYNTIITKTLAVVSVIGVWGVSIFMALIQLAWWPSGVGNMTEEEKAEFEMHHAQASAIYHLITLILFFGVPLFVLVFCYIRIFMIVRYHEAQIRKVNRPAGLLNSDAEEKKPRLLSIQAQWKSAIIFMVMIAVFVVCWFPFYIHRLNELLSLYHLPHWVEYVFFYYTRYFTSFANPVLYILGKHDFRKTLFPPKQESRTQTTSLLDHRQSNASKV